MDAVMDRISFFSFRSLKTGRAVGRQLSVRTAFDAALVVHPARYPMELGVLVAQHLVSFIGANKGPRVGLNTTFRLRFWPIFFNCNNHSIH